MVLVGTQRPSSSALYFQGTSRPNGSLGFVIGDGLRSAGGTVLRLGTKSNVAGASSYPVSGDQTVSIRGADAVGDTRSYQVWYRNADARFCTSDTFNPTNGLTSIWSI